MTLTLAQIKSATVGATAVTADDHGIHFARFTDEEITAMAALNRDFSPRGRSTCGVRLDFHTNSRTLRFTAPAGGKFELLVDGLMEQAWTADRDKSAPMTFTLDGADHRLTLAFPSHSVGVLAAVELDDGATFTPHTHARRFLFYGDSITQGWDSRYDTASYAWQVSTFFDANSLIRGVGGGFFHGDMFAEADNDPDTVFVAYGVNDLHQNKTAATFRPLVATFLDKIAARYGNRRVYVITPIWCGKVDGKAMTMPEVRTIITEEAAARGLTPIDGRSLMPPLAPLMADEWLHPNDLGFSLYAQNLIKALLP